MEVSATIHCVLEPGELQEWLAVSLTVEAMLFPGCQVSLEDARQALYDRNVLTTAFEAKYGLDDTREWTLSRSTGKIWYSG